MATTTTPGTQQPFSARLRYQADVATAAADLKTVTAADQTVFTSNATAGQDAFNGLETGVVVLAVVMAVSCAWGLSRRLAEYR